MDALAQRSEETSKETFFFQKLGNHINKLNKQNKVNIDHSTSTRRRIEGPGATIIGHHNRKVKHFPNIFSEITKLLVGRK